MPACRHLSHTTYHSSKAASIHLGVLGAFVAIPGLKAIPPYSTLFSFETLDFGPNTLD